MDLDADVDMDLDVNLDMDGNLDIDLDMDKDLDMDAMVHWQLLTMTRHKDMRRETSGNDETSKRRRYEGFHDNLALSPD
jgi:hypothetical protein